MFRKFYNWLYEKYEEKCLISLVWMAIMIVLCAPFCIITTISDSMISVIVGCIFIVLIVIWHFWHLLKY